MSAARQQAAGPDPADLLDMISSSQAEILRRLSVGHPLFWRGCGRRRFIPGNRLGCRWEDQSSASSATVGRLVELNLVRLGRSGRVVWRQWHEATGRYLDHETPAGTWQRLVITDLGQRVAVEALRRG